MRLAGVDAAVGAVTPEITVLVLGVVVCTVVSLSVLMAADGCV